MPVERFAANEKNRRGVSRSREKWTLGPRGCGPRSSFGPLRASLSVETVRAVYVSADTVIAQ